MFMPRFDPGSASNVPPVGRATPRSVNRHGGAEREQRRELHDDRVRNSLSPPVTVAGGGAPSTTTRPAATTTTTLAPRATLALKPTGAPLRYLMTSAPVLTWHVTGAAKVHVYGSGVNADGTSGNVAVCPGTQANAICGGMKAGSYVYALDASDVDGNLVAHRTVALTIG
jgi:hypothetical protein